MMINELDKYMQLICSKNYICQGQVHYQKERVDTSLPMNEKV